MRAASASRKDIRKRKPCVVTVPDSVQEVFTEHLLCAGKEGCSRESLKGSGLQSEENRVCAVGGVL